MITLCGVKVSQSAYSKRNKRSATVCIQYNMAWGDSDMLAVPKKHITAQSEHVWHYHRQPFPASNLILLMPLAYSLLVTVRDFANRLDTAFWHCLTTCVPESWCIASPLPSPPLPFPSSGLAFSCVCNRTILVKAFALLTEYRCSIYSNEVEVACRGRHMDIFVDLSRTLDHAQLYVGSQDVYIENVYNSMAIITRSIQFYLDVLIIICHDQTKSKCSIQKTWSPLVAKSRRAQELMMEIVLCKHTEGRNTEAWAEKRSCKQSNNLWHNLSALRPENHS